MLLSAAFLVLLTVTGTSQINYFENWENAGDGAAGWTGGERSTSTVCAGSASYGGNVSSLSSVTITSPTIGPSNGLPVDFTFSFRRQNNSAWGGMRARWRVAPSGAWSAWTDFNVSNDNCNSYGFTFTPAAGANVQVQMEAQRNFCLFCGSRRYNWDNVSLQQQPLECPDAAFSVTDNCGAGTYQLTANVAVAGPNAQLFYSVDGVPQTPVSITGNGVWNTPAIPVTSAVDYTLSNDHVVLGLCSSLTGYRYSTCPITLDCNSLLTLEHCYRNNDDRSWHFVNPSGGTVDIQFLPTSPIVSGDGINFFNGPPGVNQVSVPIYTANDLSTIGLYTSPGDVFSFAVEADGAGSCGDGTANAPWTFEVKCTPECAAPLADVNVVASNCGNLNYFIEVDLYYLGETGPDYNDEAGIRYVVDGGAPVELTGLVEDVYILGPFFIESIVSITLLHENETLCNSSLGNFGRLTPCPPANDLCGGAQTLTVNAAGACMGAAVAGTTFDAGAEIANPGCTPAGTVSDVWYQFNSGWNQSPLTIGITPGTIGHWGVQVFSGSCGGTSLICNNNSPTSVNVPNLGNYQDYWIRVYTNTAQGVAGSFSICLSATPRPTSCGTTVYDTGGPGGNYGTNQNYTVTYCSNSFGDLLTATFTQFVVGNILSPANLAIYDGPNTSAPLIGNFSGTTLPGPFTSSHPSGCLTFAFTSGSGLFYSTEAGWAANLTCCEAPAASVTATVVQSPVCVGQAVELGTTTDIGTVFSWTGPGGFTSNSASPVISNAVPANSGSYTVVARSGPNGCPSAPSSVNVSVVAPPANLAATANTLFACDGNSVQLGASFAGSASVILQNNFNDGAQGWTTLNQSTGGAPANAAWTLRNSPYIGITSNDATQFWQSNSDAQGSGGITNTSLTSPAFSTQGYSTLNLSFWHFYRHLGSDQARVQVSTNGTTWTNAQVFSTTQGAASGFVQASINLNAYLDQPTLYIRFNYSANFGWYWNIDNVVVSGTPVSVTYAWSSDPAGLNTTLAGPNTTINETTTYTVEVSSAPGCSSTAAVTVQVGLPIQAIVTGPASFEYCIGASAVNLSGSASGGGQPYLLEWIDSDNNVVGTGPDLVNFQPATSTTVSLRVSDACGDVDVFGTRAVTVNQLPNVQVTPSQVSNCGGGTSTLEASGAVNYSWAPATGLNTTTGSTVVADPSDFITVYTVTGTDGNGCVNTATAQVIVSAVPNAGATTNAAACVNSGLPPGQGLGLSCPPFVASSGAAFPGSNFPTNLFELFNQAGATQFRTVSTVDLPPLPPGASPVAARLVLNNIEAFSPSWLSEIRVATTGVISLPETQISVVNAPGVIAQVIITIPAASYPPAGGLVNLRLRETFNDGVQTVLGVVTGDNLDPDGRVGSASIEVDYSFPTTALWYDAPVGGNLVGTGVPFNPITAGAVNSAVGGMYTFYAACEGNGCESTRTPAYFSVGDKFVTMEISTDVFASQTTWAIESVDNGMTVCSGGPYFDGFALNLTQSCCMPDGCYILRVSDSAGDGILNGGYQLRNADNNKRIIDNKSNGAFGSISQITGNAYSFCLPMGDLEPIYSSCDKYWWRTGEFFVATPDDDVSAEWIEGAANTAQSTTSGYEFWFFNPNGGYSFRRFRSHRLSDGFGPASAVRACHMKVNNWAVANHIPEFDLMNVRIRTVINGVSGLWGPACRFVRDEALSQCPPTKLMDIPGNQFLSCGQFRQFGVPGQRIHSRPVAQATEYQWRFRIPAENTEIIRSSTSYFLNLNWGPGIAPPLEPGKTYEVDVRAFRNGAWCVDPLNPDSVWGDICLLTIQNTPAQGGNQNLALAGEGEFNLWPNPNRGDQFWVNMEGIADDVLAVAVDIHDLTGKRVVAREIPVTDSGMLYTVIDLNGDLANGVYLVSIIAGDKRYTERLIIAN
jgi:hypothetical protein